MRRRYITHWPYQLGFTLSFVKGAFVAMAIPGVGLLLTLRLVVSNLTLTPYQQQLADSGWIRLLLMYTSFMALFCLIFAVFGFYLSYKFVGPLKRIETWLAQLVAKKKPGELVLRDGDELVPLVEMLRRVFEKKKR